MKFFIIFNLIFFTLVAGAQQQAQIRSHYPQTAFVAGRLLPFQLIQATRVKVTEVQTEGGPSCVGFGDPFYSDQFHLYCENKEPGVRLVVTYTDSSGEAYTVNSSRFKILDLAQARPVAGDE